MNSTQPIIVSNDVDLSEIENLLRYLAIGFSLSSSFQVVKSRQASRIPKSEADRLRAEFSSLFNRKPKAYLRKRLPLLLIGLVKFGTDKSEAIGLDQRTLSFRDLIRKYDENQFTPEERSSVLTMADSLSRPYYANTLNTALDPLSAFFEGRKPRSYSNAVAEFVSTLDVPTVIRVEEEEKPERTIRLIEDDDPERVIRVVDDEKSPEVHAVLPTFEILEDIETKDEDMKKEEPKVVPAKKPQRDENLKYIFLGVGALATIIGVYYFSRD